MQINNEFLSSNKFLNTTVFAGPLLNCSFFNLLPAVDIPAILEKNYFQNLWVPDSYIQ